MSRRSLRSFARRALTCGDGPRSLPRVKPPPSRCPSQYAPGNSANLRHGRRWPPGWRLMVSGSSRSSSNARPERGRRHYINGQNTALGCGYEAGTRTPCNAVRPLRKTQFHAARQEKGMRALETLVVLTVATVAFLWVILAHSTPEEHARLLDSIGQSTHIAWR